MTSHSIDQFQKIKNTGSLSCNFSLPENWKTLALAKDYNSLYADIERSLPLKNILGAQIDQILNQVYGGCQTWEYEWMLALRAGPQDKDQEGIWHDDSSRDLALSLSLNLIPEKIAGGMLLMRPRLTPNEVTTIAARTWGEGHLFATGKWGWEHKTTRVTSGNRLVLVVWITLTP